MPQLQKRFDFVWELRETAVCLHFLFRWRAAKRYRAEMATHAVMQSIIASPGMQTQNPNSNAATKPICM